MITFDASKFMKALDNYVGFRSITPPTDESVRRERAAEAQLLEQLKVLEDAVKATDRLLLAQVEIAGLVKSANEFLVQKETMPVAALGCVVRALSVLSDLGEEAEPSIQDEAPAQVTTAQETSMPKTLRQKDVLALKRLLQCVRFEKASFNHIFSDSADPLPKTEAEVTEFIKRRTRLYIETWVTPIIKALIARGEGLDDPNGERVLDNASRGN